MTKHPIFSSAAIVLTSAAAFIFSGCGKSDNTAAGKSLKIGISIPSADHGWTGGVVYHANEVKKEIEAANPDVRVIVSTAASSAEQVDRVENLLVQGIDALVILPHEPAPLSEICGRAVREGVKVVVVDRNIASRSQDLLVAGDNTGFGRVSGEAIAEAMGGKGAIVMMEGVQCDVNTQRVVAFKKVIEQFPGIKIIDSGSADWNTEKGLRLMENFLQKHPKIDVVWTGDDDVSIGALKAIEEAGRTDIKMCIGGAGSKLMIKRVMDGDPLVRFTVTYPPAMIAVGAREALKILRGETPESDSITIPAEIVDINNAAEFYFPDSVY